MLTYTIERFDEVFFCADIDRSELFISSDVIREVSQPKTKTNSIFSEKQGFRTVLDHSLFDPFPNTVFIRPCDICYSKKCFYA